MLLVAIRNSRFALLALAMVLPAFAGGCATYVGEPLDMSPQMTEILRQMGQDVPKVKRILEVNPAHPILQKLQARFEKDKRDPVVREFAELLYGQALLAEGSQPNDPAGFGKKLADVLERGL